MGKGNVVTGKMKVMRRECGGDFNFTKILNFEKVCDAKAILRLFRYLRRNDTKKKRGMWQCYSEGVLFVKSCVLEVDFFVDSS